MTISNYSDGFQTGYIKGITESQQTINNLEDIIKDYKRLLDIKLNTIRITKGDELVEILEILDTPQGLFIKLKQGICPAGICNGGFGCQHKPELDVNLNKGGEK
jgi:hypothetical protein